jgi:hypothetical protein
MTAHNCLFQVSLYQNETPLLSFDWTDDKDAVIEAMDEINHRSSRDLCASIDEQDYRRGVMIVSKNGNKLLNTSPFDLKPIDDKIVHAVQLIMRCDNSLKASVTTRGSGRVDLPEDITIKGCI